ncbi:MAG: hypothetical protein NTV61_04745 [Candidatus Bathyarchaeota archaeon]|nr:hypothetical protein [Candidatus Bathyarchaeota archaeon]
METPAPRAFGKRGALILIAALAIILLAASTSHLFILRGGSETQTKAALTAKALQLFGVPPGAIVCGDNLQGYNITGYRLMSIEEIRDLADTGGDAAYVGVGRVDLTGDDTSVTIGNWHATPRNANNTNLAGEAIIYQFHRHPLDIWSWDDSNHILS